MKKRSVNAVVQRRWMKVVNICFWAVFTPAVFLLLINLIAMNVEQSAGALIVIFGAQVGYTGLLYNRARAHENGTLRRRTLVAAELGFRAALLFLVVALFAASWFALLLKLGVDPVPINWHPTTIAGIVHFRFVPTIMAMFTILLAEVSFVCLHRSLAVVARRHITYSAKRDVFRRR